MRLVILVTALAVILAVPTATAAVPEEISYQGVLKDAGGSPVADGDYGLSFSLYNAETGGTLLWSEAQTVPVEGGIFNVLLGEVTPLTLPFDDPYWLSVSVEGEPPLTPRIKLTGAAYAMYAKEVESDLLSSLDGVTNDEGNIDLIGGSNITITPNDGANTITFSATGGGDDGDWTISGSDVYRASGNVGVGTATPLSRIDVHSSGAAESGSHFTNDNTGSTASDGLALGVSSGGQPYLLSYESSLVLGSGGSAIMAVYPSSALINGPTSIYGNLSVWGFDMDTGAADGYVLTADASGNGTWQPAAGGDDGDWSFSGPDIYYASGNVGIGTATPAAPLHVNGNVFVPYSGAYAVGSTSYDGVSWDAGTGSVALGNGITSLAFFAGDPLARAVLWESGDLGVGLGHAVLPNARVHVETDLSDAIFGKCTHTAQVDYIGVRGESEPVDYYGVGGDFEGDWIGVEGFVLPSGSHYYYGGYFAAEGGSGTNYAVYGSASGTGTNYGVFGHSDTGDYAGFFTGNVHATGSVTSGLLRSKIDHPLDPGNMYLNQNAVESDEMKTIYDGVVELGTDGAAWVEMPEWFDALNTELRYQLTCVGGYAPVYVAEEVRDNRFMIAGGTPGLKVCWQVTGVRQDAFARANSKPVEEMKPADERGLYLNPFALGFGREMSTTYPARAEFERKAAEAGTDAAGRASR